MVTVFFPRVEESRTGVHRFKVREKRPKRDLKGNFFVRRVVPVWTKLQEEATEAGAAVEVANGDV